MTNSLEDFMPSTPESKIAPPVDQLGPSEADRAISVIVTAFTADPVARWVFPDAQQYLMQLPGLIRAYAGSAFEQGSAFGTEDRLGVALWLPPGIRPDHEAVGGFSDPTVSEESRADMAVYFEEQARMHPEEPHWYLPMIAVDPAKQGHGAGSALLTHTLAIADQQGMPAYLEASSGDSRRLYERHGFEVTGEIQHGSSPTTWPMLRQPRV